MNRYSAGNNLLHAGAFFVPVLPFLLLSQNNPSGQYYTSPLDPLVLWLCGLLVSYGLIAVHELGHATAGYLAGIKIKDVTVGHWKKLGTVSIGSVPVILRAAPSSGYVTLVVSPLVFSPPRITAFLLAGVVAEAGVIALAAAFLSPHQADSLGEAMLEMIRLSVLCLGGWHIIFNLLPVQGYVGGTVHPTDGRQLLDFWLTRREHGAHKQRLVEALEINALCAAKDFKAARERLLEMLAKESNDDLLISLGSLHVECGDLDKAEALWRELLAKAGASSPRLAQILDSLCCLSLYRGRSDLLKEAEAWSAEALRYSPHAITLKGTRGSVLIELGHVEAGLTLAHEVVRKSDCREDQTVGAAYLAKGYAAKGDRAQALRWLEKARAIHPEHPVVKRIASELSAGAVPIA